MWGIEQEPLVQINSISHYVFCPYRWGLMFIDNEWEDNFRTIKGDIFHENVHQADFDEKRSGKYSVRGMPIYNDEIGLYGVADMVEFLPSNKDGIFIENKMYKPVVIEYKVGKYIDSKTIRDSDKMQLIAQMACIESMFGIVGEGYIYYKEINRRIKADNYKLDKERLINIISEMREYLKNRSNPKRKAKEGCKGCSLINICLPKTKLLDTKVIINKQWNLN